jgi:hypothetical protein
MYTVHPSLPPNLAGPGHSYILVLCLDLDEPLHPPLPVHPSCINRPRKTWGMVRQGASSPTRARHSPSHLHAFLTPPPHVCSYCSSDEPIRVPSKFRWVGLKEEGAYLSTPPASPLSGGTCEMDQTSKPDHPWRAYLVLKAGRVFPLQKYTINLTQINLYKPKVKVDKLVKSVGYGPRSGQMIEQLLI